jgi:hypothetical protein
MGPTTGTRLKGLRRVERSAEARRFSLTAMLRPAAAIVLMKFLRLNWFFMDGDF